MRIPSILSFAFTIALSFITNAQTPDPVPLKNWFAPLYWQATTADEIRIARERAANEGSLSPQLQTPGSTPALNVLVAITPCRLADTRQAWPAPYGSGAWGPQSTTTVNATSTASGNCALPVAQAYSANITVVMTYGGALGYMTAYPAGTIRPVVSTLNNINGLATMANSAVIPAGTGAYAGQFNIYLSSVLSIDVVIDINGYYVSPNALALGAGTAAAPSLTFSNDTTSGLYSSGAGTVSVATGGTNKLTVTSTGVGIGTAPAYPLDVAGNINFSGSLWWQGAPVLQLQDGSQGGDVVLGPSAFRLNTTGLNDTAIGYAALASNTAGVQNTATGWTALSANKTGSANTATGSSALFSNTTGTANTGTGASALGSNSNGSENTAMGATALGDNTTGSYNTALGWAALYNNTTGTLNTALGSGALIGNSTGTNNIAVGVNAGFNVSAGANNIHIGSAGSFADNGTIRIGTPATQTSFFAAGINGVTTGLNDAVSVVIDGNGQLGTTNSSRRFKEDIQDMGGASHALMQLRPVTFRYKQPFADGSKPVQYGLIAEEVEKVYPDLVARSADGKVQSVKYQVLDSMLLNELQKQQKQIQQQAETIQQQEEQDRQQTAEIRSLETRLATLEEAMRSIVK